jgi:DNA-binding MarR family transcriptional regulator
MMTRRVTAEKEREQAAIGLWVDLVQTTAMLRAQLGQALEQLGVSPEETELLMRLAAAPEERLRMVDASLLLLTSKSGVTRLVDRLEQRGLAERAPCPTDRRVVYSTLTEAGRRLLDEARPVFVRALEDALNEHLTAAELARLRAALQHVLAGNGVRSDGAC